MKTRSQEFAVAVWDRAQESRDAKNDKGQKTFNKQQYGGMAHYLPTLIQSCGLTQALAFVLSRGKDGHKNLLNDLAIVLGHNNGKKMWEEVIKASLGDYMRLSERSIEALLWFKRFAQSELKIENGGELDLDAADSGEGA